MLDLPLIEWVTKMKPGSNSVEGHPQLSHNGHPMDGALVGAGSLWPRRGALDPLVSILSITTDSPRTKYLILVKGFWSYCTLPYPKSKPQKAHT
jgi:hypothetical protein